MKKHVLIIAGILGCLFIGGESGAQNAMKACAQPTATVGKVSHSGGGKTDNGSIVINFANNHDVYSVSWNGPQKESLDNISGVARTQENLKTSAYSLIL